MEKVWDLQICEGTDKHIHQVIISFLNTPSEDLIAAWSKNQPRIEMLFQGLMGSDSKAKLEIGVVSTNRNIIESTKVRPIISQSPVAQIISIHQPPIFSTPRNAPTSETNSSINSQLAITDSSQIYIAQGKDGQPIDYEFWEDFATIISGIILLSFQDINE